MKLRQMFTGSARAAITGAVLCTCAGLLLLVIGGWPVFLGYDLLFLVRETPRLDNIVVIYMDDDSFRKYGQTSTPNWDRNLHAELLDRLTKDDAQLVVFDVILSEPGTREANSNLVRAIRANGKVVLAAGLTRPSRAQIATRQPLLPLSEFEDAARATGFAEVDFGNGPGRVVRRHHAGSEHHPPLPVIAARAAGIKVGLEDRWLNFYGPALTLPYFSYSMVSDQPPGAFRDKYVFVGAKPITLKAHDETDEFRTPHSHWRGEYMPGVEIGATAFLNLIRGDAIERLSWGKETLLVVFTGALMGVVLGLSRPGAAGVFAIAAILVAFLAAAAVAGQHLWFGWTVIAFGQIPAGLAWSMRNHFYRLRLEKEVAEKTLVETSRLVETSQAAAAAAKSGLVIPDHALLRRVGKGGYGEVWLARNAIGAFHAVKIVQRREFPSDVPYEREFRGIQKFMPISRSHAGFVHVLHVGRNDQEGFFYYIMEACDDEAMGQKIDPDHYTPRTLALLLARRGTLVPEECLQLGVSLSETLHQLHQHQLVHRDIKPANIIYVAGAPKLADIGLVTELGQGKDVSLIGTEGYIPPEGPGTPAADIYALGKLLYEASTGRDRQMFPEVPTAILERPSEDLLRRFHAVVFKACETDPRDRYQSAAEVQAALLSLQKDT